MNFLILSVGRRTKLIEYFVENFKNFGKVICTDCDVLAPALYTSDKKYILPTIDNPSYIENVKDICLKENIKGIISLIDPELSLISKNRKIFEDIGVSLFLSPYDATEICFDKFKMYKFLKTNLFNTAKSYINIEEFNDDYIKNNIKFPVFIKPVHGSASINVQKVEQIEELEFIMKKYNDIMIQEFLDGKEIGVDVYVDILSGEVISIFAKEKIRMRSGETDKSKSLVCNKLFKMIEEFVLKLGIKGPADIDVFKIGSEYFISEVNPRFGGGYPHAYECGENFIEYIKNNLSGVANNPSIGNYEDEVFMLKCDNVKMISKN